MAIDPQVWETIGLAAGSLLAGALGLKGVQKSRKAINGNGANGPTTEHLRMNDVMTREQHDRECGLKIGSLSEKIEEIKKVGEKRHDEIMAEFRSLRGGARN